MQHAHHLIAGGGILYDASRVSKPSAELFDPNKWAAAADVSSTAGGRGGVLFIRNGDERWVLRHYRRGGLIAKLVADRYVWTGAERTRSFREWCLLAEMRQIGLPVPAPIAALYERRGLFYRADIITEEIRGGRTLSQFVGTQPLNSGWRRVGATIARFHRQGIRHADLNAHNILIAADAVYVLDFDRGRRLRRGPWEQQVLARLLRSLNKLKHQNPALHFEPMDWMALMDGYEQRVAVSD